MINQKTNSVERFAGQHFRSGMAKEQLIFVIICSVALLVAAVALIHFLTGSSGTGNVTSAWQCLACDSEFSKTTTEMPPIACPKCDGQAVRVMYRKCPSCGNQMAVNRLRLSEADKARRDAMATKLAESPGTAPARPPMMGLMNMQETQYRVKQQDGSYGWTDWMSGSLSPRVAMEWQRNMRCSKCDALLFSKPARSGN